MKTLEYYSADGTHRVFDGYEIDENGVVTNVATGRPMAQIQDVNGYNKITLRHDGARRAIRVARALASTFLGSPPTNRHTVDHIDQIRKNDSIGNIRWLCTSGQVKNRDMPSNLKSVFVIVKDGVEHMAKEWVKIFTNPGGMYYTEGTIRKFAQRQQHGFRYKTFPNIRAEVWKAVPSSNNKMGEWFISNKNRMKYKTAYAENVLTVGQLHKVGGYPSVRINGKQCLCHVLSMMTFRPREYVAKLPGDMLLHKHDDKLDFNPFRLRWGTPSENRTDAHDNGKYDGTTSARKPVASYINGVIEREYESLYVASKYLQDNGYPKAHYSSVSCALDTNAVRYGRTWRSTL
jgi:hypothetical protein